jgi:hypothetical protein
MTRQHRKNPLKKYNQIFPDKKLRAERIKLVRYAVSFLLLNSNKHHFKISRALSYLRFIISWASGQSLFQDLLSLL